MSAFRFAGCRHPAEPDEAGPPEDGRVRWCPQCMDYRTVREVESLPVRSGLDAELERRQGQPYHWDPDQVSRQVMQASGKGQLALLVTDARGVVIAGIRATGGLTQLQYRPQEGSWDFAGAFSGPEVLEGSYALLNNLGTDPPEPTEGDQDTDWVHTDGTICVAGHYAETGMCVEGAGPVMPRAAFEAVVDRAVQAATRPAPMLLRRKPGAALARAEQEWGPT